ncbi:MAG TPA: hypothetical protein VGO11_20285 [Chthoniobacteraceae bacterium]|jgi:hypothetical protein|nr:hypothetical protein [Chthoniobacteraceae bacterium]
MNKSYYPPTNDGRADFWDRILTQSTLLLAIGFTAPEIVPIIADARWGVYLYRTVRKAYEVLQKGIIQWCDAYTDGPDGAAGPEVPIVPAWPGLPVDTITQGIEERREAWVQRAKKLPGYDKNIGIQLGIEAPDSPFEPATYKAVLNNLLSSSAHTVSGKFRKANGQIDGINFYGRKEGTMAWTLLGRFNATPFSALVPLAGAAPEPWEFLARAVKRDVEIGFPSDVVQVIVRG